MKKLLIALLLAGCVKSSHKEVATICYKLDMCDVTVNGTVEWPNNNSFGPVFTVYCLYGFDAYGNKTEVKHFFARDALSAWSIFHPEAKECK